MNENDFHFLMTLNIERSLTKAAEKLFISQPALSYRIRALEKELGVPLFVRSKTGITLTPQGEYLVEFATKQYDQILKMKESIVSIASEEIHGTINLGTSLVFAHYELPAIIKQFHDLYPSIKFNIISGHSSNIFTMLNNQEVNVGILRGDFKWHEESHVLFKEPIVIASEHSIEIEQLPDVPRVKFKTDPVLYHQINQWWNERFSVEPNVIIETSNTDTCLELIKAGMGYSILPVLGLKNFHGHIHPIKWLNGELFTRQTNLFMRSQSNNQPAIKAFSDFVIQYYQLDDPDSFDLNQQFKKIMRLNTDFFE
jgi:DNA-binding transcriptional LysR family regulator